MGEPIKYTLHSVCLYTKRSINRTTMMASNSSYKATICFYLLLVVCGISAVSSAAHRKRPLSAGGTENEDTHTIKGGFGNYVKCKVGDREPHPYKCDRFLQCSTTGFYHTVLCPTLTGYDSTLRDCTRAHACSDVTKHVVLRRKRQLNEEDNVDEGSGDITDITLEEDNTLNTNSSGDKIDAVTSINAESEKKPDMTSEAPADVMTTVGDVVMDTVTNSTERVVTTTTALTSTATSKPNLTTLEVLIPDKSVEPPYVVVTVPPEPEITTAKNITDAIDDVTKSSAAGAIIGIVIALIVIAVIITVVVILVKKKKLKLSGKIPVKRKKKIVTRMENPQYRDGQPATYRFSRDSKLEVGPTTVNLTKFNNPNLADTPIPKVLQSDSPGPKRTGSLPKSIASRRDKRRAPAPPNPFGDPIDLESDLYEKASQGSAEGTEMQTFTVKNENATSEPDDNANEPTYPLLKRKDKSDTPVPKESSNGKVAKNDVNDDENEADKTEKTSLLPKEKSQSKSSIDPKSADVTLDDYDLTKNPFFDDKKK